MILVYDLRYIRIIQNLQSVTRNVTIEATEPDGNCFFFTCNKQINIGIRELSPTNYSYYLQFLSKSTTNIPNTAGK